MKEIKPKPEPIYNTRKDCIWCEIATYVMLTLTVFWVLIALAIINSLLN